MALSAEQIRREWVAQGGDPRAAAAMARIALRESGGRPKINNKGLNRNGTVDHGLYQINDVWRKDPVIGKLFESGAIYTPEGNTRAAIRILRVQGPKAWATYNAATDSKYLSGLQGKGKTSSDPVQTEDTSTNDTVGTDAGTRLQDLAIQIGTPQRFTPRVRKSRPTATVVRLRRLVL